MTQWITNRQAANMLGITNEYALKLIKSKEWIDRKWMAPEGHKTPVWHYPKFQIESLRIRRELESRVQRKQAENRLWREWK